MYDMYIPQLLAAIKLMFKNIDFLSFGSCFIQLYEQEHLEDNAGEQNLLQSVQHYTAFVQFIISC